MAATDCNYRVKDDDGIERAKRELFGGVIDLKKSLDNFIESLQQASVGDFPKKEVFDKINNNLALFSSLMHVARRNPKGE